MEGNLVHAHFLNPTLVWRKISATPIPNNIPKTDENNNNIKREKEQMIGSIGHVISLSGDIKTEHARC